jgi:hypothetical protein
MPRRRLSPFALSARTSFPPPSDWRRVFQSRRDCGLLYANGVTPSSPALATSAYAGYADGRIRFLPQRGCARSMPCLPRSQPRWGRRIPFAITTQGSPPAADNLGLEDATPLGLKADDDLSSAAVIFLAGLISRRALRRGRRALRQTLSARIAIARATDWSGETARFLDPVDGPLPSPRSPPPEPFGLWLVIHVVRGSPDPAQVSHVVRGSHDPARALTAGLPVAESVTCGRRCVTVGRPCHNKVRWGSENAVGLARYSPARRCRCQQNIITPEMVAATGFERAVHRLASDGYAAGGCSGECLKRSLRLLLGLDSL